MLLAGAITATVAHAQPPEGQRLFEEGRALMLDGNFAEACPRLAESQRLAPHLVTLLNVGVCHEKLGKVATAWVDFQQALTSARTEGDQERARFAQTRLDAIGPRVPWLVISAPAESRPDGLEVTLDGAALDTFALGKEIPVDPGHHVLAARAPKHKPIEGSLELAEGDHKTWALPQLEREEEKHDVIAPPPAGPKRDFVAAYFSFFHPLSTNLEHAFASTRFGFDLIYGRAGELDDGVQIGLVNATIGKEGVATGNMSGVQLAPFFGFNYAGGSASGLQLAMLGNVAGNGLRGAQVSFTGNVSAADAHGAQLAMITNVAAGELRGVQVGAVNVAGNVHGAQVGWINVGKKIEGFTLGLVNYADDVEGVPIGVVSVTRTGGIHPTAWSSTSTFANVGIKFATKYTYTMIAGHYAYLPSAEYAATGSHPVLALEGRDYFGGGFFIGGHVPLGKPYVDFDLGFSGLVAPKSSYFTRFDGTTGAYHAVLLEPRARVMLGYSFDDHASVFLGASAMLRARIVNDGQEAVVRGMPEVFAGVQF
jgi:hypothetical protein